MGVLKGSKRRGGLMWDEEDDVGRSRQWIVIASHWTATRRSVRE